MKREIKFRALFKKFRTSEKVWLYSEPNHEVKDLMIYVQLTDWLQFTGLTDKNGVEIYEGDIIQDDIEMITDAVVWSNEGMGWDAVPNYPDKLAIEDMEVIGNIHENPELLK